MLHLSKLTLHAKGPLRGPVHKSCRPRPVLDAVRGKEQETEAEGLHR